MDIKNSHIVEYQKILTSLLFRINIEYRYVHIKGVPFKECIEFIFHEISKCKHCKKYSVSQKRKLFVDIFNDLSRRVLNEQLKVEFRKYSDDCIIGPLYDLMYDLTRPPKPSRMCCF